MTLLHSFIKCLLVISCLSFISYDPVQGGNPEYVELIDRRAYGVYTPTFSWHMAKFLCNVQEGTSRQIDSPSTIVELAKFFRDMSSAHELARCRDKYNKVVQAMAGVILAGNGDMCDTKKVDAVVNYHKMFVSKSSPETIGEARIPKLLELFYLKYAYIISKTCKSRILEHIETPDFRKAERKFSEKTTELKELDRIIGEYSTMSSSISGSIKSFYNIDLLWSVIDRTPVDPEADAVLSAPSAANGFKRVTLATSGSEKILKVQRECQNLKPIYESPFLTTIRMIDLGYYLDDEPFARQLSKRPNLMRILGLVIICETLLPMRVLQDDTLDLGDSKFLKLNPEKKGPTEVNDNQPEVYKNQPEVYNNQPEVNNHQPEATKVTQKPKDLPGSTTSTRIEPMSDKEIKKMKGNIKSRDNKRKQMLRGFLRKIKFKFSSFFGKVFHRRDPNRGEDITHLLDVFK